MVRKSEIDDKDLKILEILEENARTPYVVIAKKLGLSEGAIRKRIKKLEELNIIKKYTIEIDYREIGKNRALIGIDTLPEKLFSVIEFIKGYKGIKKIYTTSGDHDLIVELIYGNNDELANFISYLNKLEGVTRVCPAIIVENIEKV